MEQAILPFDSCARKHRGNPRSVAANLRIHKHKDSDRERIVTQVASQGFAGLTIGEARLWNPKAIAVDGTLGRFKYPNEYSGRFRELELLGKIFKSGRERNGEVYVSRLEWVNPEQRKEK